MSESNETEIKKETIEPELTPEQVAELEAAQAQKEVNYIDNADTICFTKDLGEFIKFNERVWMRSEDSFEETEYFQVDPENLEEDEKQRLPSGTLDKSVFGDLTKIFIIGIKDCDLESEIVIEKRAFMVEMSNVSDDETWAIQYTLLG